MKEFAGYKTMPKYVVSTTLTEDNLVSNWGETTILRSLDQVAALKETEGGPIIVHGSASPNHSLSDAGLIDRYHLLVYPLLLGAGKRLFSTTDKDTQKLKLVEYGAYANGQLNGNSGSGRWNGASSGIACSGRWDASRQ